MGRKTNITFVVLQAYTFIKIKIISYIVYVGKCLVGLWGQRSEWVCWLEATGRREPQATTNIYRIVPLNLEHV